MFNGRIGVWVRKRVRRMLEVLRRWASQFSYAFIALLICIVSTLIFAKGDYIIWIVIFMSILAIICFTFFIIPFVYDIKDGRRKDRETKAAKDHEALKQCFRRINPEWTEEQVEIAATGDKKPYRPVDSLDDDGWTTPREAYKKSRPKKK